MWDTFKPKDKIWYCWHLNGASAYLLKNGDSWQTAFKTIPFCERTNDFSGPDTENPFESLPITSVWGTGDEVILHPYFSSPPYILNSRDKIRIAPGQKVYFTAFLPPMLRFEITSETVFSEFMPLVPSQTLYGPDTISGKLGYSLKDVLLPKQAEDMRSPSCLIRCDILIVNYSKTMFEPEYFVLLAEPLNVYVHMDRLVSDTLEIDVSGVDQKTNCFQIRSEGRIVNAGNKNRAGENFIRQSVDIIKVITKDMV